MKREWMRPGLRRALASLVFFHASLAHASPQPSPAAATEKPGQLVGTVRVADLEAGTLELITGVGHAVRIVTMEVASDCEFRIPGAAPVLASLARGECVRVAYVPAPAGALPARIAVSVEVVEIPPEGGPR